MTMRGKRGSGEPYRGWSRQSRDPAFFGSSTTASRRADRTDDSDDVDHLSNRVGGVQLLLPRREDDDATSNREQRSTFSAPRERRGGGVVLAARNVSSTEKPRKEHAPTLLAKDATMVDGVKFVNDNMDICDQLMDFLSSENSNYNVICAIGPQGAGKSTVLSMIGGNNSQDMYRQYIFRPASREALESSRHQTTKIHVYITKTKQIFLDCQAANCASVLDEALRYSRSSLTDGRYAINNYIEIIKLIAFLIQVSHTILVCSDWIMDIETIKLIRTAEMFRANFEHIREIIPQYNATRKVNLVMLHTRAKSSDFSETIIKQRAELLRSMFSDSRRIRVNDDNEWAVLPLADIKPRKDGLSGSYPPATPVIEKILDAQEVVDFDKSMRRLRLIIAQLPKDRFATGEQEITEKQWYLLAKSIWNDPLFDALLDQNQQLICETFFVVMRFRFTLAPGCRFKVRVIAICICWYVISSASSITNKVLLQGYPYPMTLSLSNLMWVPVYSVPLLRMWETKAVKLTSSQYNKYLTPISIGKALAVVSAYFSLWKVPVSYAQTVKASMPLFAVFLSKVVLKETHSYKVYASLLPIVAGVVIASATELSFSMIGMLSALFSTCTYSFLNILVKKLLKESEIHPIRLLALNSQLAALMVFPFWLFKDAFLMVSNLGSKDPAAPSPDLWMLCLLAMTGLLSFLQSVCAFLLIHELTALSYAVCNATKRIIVIGSSLITLHNPVTGANVFGMMLSIFGVFFYNRAKQEEKMSSHSLPFTRSHTVLSDATLVEMDKEDSDLMYWFLLKGVLKSSIVKWKSPGRLRIL
ncbi:unnamed protein product [Cylicocyclus nassatus]|uniref:Sugar phosphate transporter domain-containing protein n=1 Tax=Cylicocyclus nassatus TaxID=53992 RepID=A0AA36MC87_CYLNA|nr:unnamed protein product [Cylicocyclus nassatus]